MRSFAPPAASMFLHHHQRLGKLQTWRCDAQKARFYAGSIVAGNFSLLCFISCYNHFHSVFSYPSSSAVILSALPLLFIGHLWCSNGLRARALLTVFGPIFYDFTFRFGKVMASSAVYTPAFYLVTHRANGILRNRPCNVVVFFQNHNHLRHTDGYTFVFLKIDDASKPSSHPEKQQASGVRNLETQTSLSALIGTPSKSPFKEEYLFKEGINTRKLLWPEQLEGHREIFPCSQKAKADGAGEIIPPMRKHLQSTNQEGDDFEAHENDKGHPSRICVQATLKHVVKLLHDNVYELASSLYGGRTEVQTPLRHAGWRDVADGLGDVLESLLPRISLSNYSSSTSC
ncbi:hypothetical protein N7497_008006 [Penicillium chrysogenum]|nr:hypothetical protein N7497_008006 [Penicillium chrysogenum]